MPGADIPVVAGKVVPTLIRYHVAKASEIARQFPRLPPAAEQPPPQPAAQPLGSVWSGILVSPSEKR